MEATMEVMMMIMMIMKKSHLKKSHLMKTLMKISPEAVVVTTMV